MPGWMPAAGRRRRDEKRGRATRRRVARPRLSRAGHAPTAEPAQAQNYNKTAQIRSIPVDSNIERLLLELTNRFPQLPKAKGRQSDYYRHIRSVIIGENGVELQLRSTPLTPKRTQSVVIVINSNKQMYGIPLFSNTYRDYWNFSFDSVLASVQPVPTTFQHELQTCIDTLGLNDASGTGSSVLYEMLVSLLGCRIVSDADSADMMTFWYEPSPDPARDDPDHCRLRFQQMWKAIYRDMHTTTNIHITNAFWDQPNDRVYQFNYASWKHKEKMKIKVKVYRPDCIHDPVDL
jgi:hypothetical protein